MSRRPDDYETYEIEGREDRDEDARWLGTVSGVGGQVFPSFYDPEEGTVFHGELDEQSETISRREGSVRDVEDRESLGEVIEEVGDELGWESLSEFAEEHLEDDEDADG